MQKQFMFHAGLIVLLLALVYGATLQNDFVYDDTPIIVRNERLAKLGNIPSFFLLEDKIGKPTGYYRPLTYVSFAIDRALWGLNPTGFTLTNIVLHMATVLLFYSVVRTLTGRALVALWASLLFGLHPLTNEVINFHSGGRNTLLCAFFSLLSLLFYLRGRKSLSVTAFTMALFSKEFALLMPVIFLMHDYLQRREKPDFRKYLPYLLPTVIYLGLRTVAVQKPNVLGMLQLTEKLWLTPYFVVRYLLHMFFPFRLQVMYDVQPDPLVGGICLLVLVTLIVILYRCTHHSDILFAIGWIALFMIPVINIIPIPQASWLADRYAYFSTMGFTLLVALLVSRLNTQRITTVIVIVLCLAYAVTDYRRNGYWKNEETFFTRMIADVPRLNNGYQLLGVYYERKGDMVNAVRYLDAAEDKYGIYPEHLIYNSALFLEAGRMDLVEKSLLRAILIEPGNPEQRLMLSVLYEQQGKNAEARSYRNQAREMSSGIEQKMAEKIVTMCREAEEAMADGSLIRAEMMLRRVLLVDPGFVPALIDLGSIKADKGELQLAIRYLEKALSLEPSNETARHNLEEMRRIQGQARILPGRPISAQQ